MDVIYELNIQSIETLRMRVYYNSNQGSFILNFMFIRNWD